MSKNTKLEVIKSDISLPGCRLTVTGLAIAKPDEATFQRVGRYLQTVDACRAWWWGDFLNAYCAWKLEQALKTKKGAGLTQDDKEQAYVHYTREFADIAGAEEITLMHWRQVARFYPVGSRLPTLTWSHHQEAWAGSDGNLSAATKWLNKAHKEGWSKTELRARIRGALSQGNDGPAPAIKIQELIGFSRWARTMTRKLSDITDADARAIRADLEPALDLARQLDARLAVSGPPQRSQRR